MPKNKDTVYTRCVDDIKTIETNGIIKAKDIQDRVEMNISKLEYDSTKLAAQLITAVCLNQYGYRSIGGRSGIYLNPDKITDFNQFGQILNNAIGGSNSKKSVVENLKKIGETNFEGQMFFDTQGNVHIEKTLEEIIEELIAI